MTISAVIMAHPRRKRWAEDLARQLDAQIVWDRYNDRVETGLRCIQAYDPAASHHLVVQDDAIVCRDLIPALELAAKVSEDRIVCLYIGAGRPLSQPRIRQLTDAADARQASWISWPGTIWGPAILYPTVHLPRLIAAYKRDPLPGYDGRINNSARRLGISWWYTWPSLVDHRDYPSNPSIANAGHPNADVPGRVARRFVGADASALDIDWASGVYETGN